LKLLREGTKSLFEFAESLENDGFSWQGRILPVKFFFVGDLKCGSLVFGVQSGNANSFCTHCEAGRADHNSGRNTYPLRTINGIIQTAKLVSKLQGSKLKVQKQIKEVHKSISHLPLFNLPLSRNVVPSLHILQGLLNTILKTIAKSDSEKIKSICRQAKVNFTYRQDLSGNDGRKLLHFIKDTCPEDLPYNPVFMALAEVQRFAVAKFLTIQEIGELAAAIDVFSSIYRQHKLSLINKLHELECHVVPFVKEFHSWRLYGEQCKYFIFYIKKLFRY